MWWYDFDGNMVEGGHMPPGRVSWFNTSHSHPHSASYEDPNQPGDLTVGGLDVYVLSMSDHHKILKIEALPPPEPMPDPSTVPTVTGGVGTIFLNGDWVKHNSHTLAQPLPAAWECRARMYSRVDKKFAERDAWCHDLWLSD